MTSTFLVLRLAYGELNIMIFVVQSWVDVC